ncbi:MAG: zinc ribbon domain-containing protein [Methylococcaceae bacterium]|nr:zinc ribbon domain-containing protein [Methylococcaceae bacterium]MDZ4155236.1 zinc ribbon domain-containing protein [Methylococcales bacterium]MDP2393492.1 zinc ribbon domain-containing protein [Methylococcaceae bacterium]MDP3021362.1 zinc ribbon domain-containing protein [Methylococcaceae bacterium]MDP3391047.1 zinc ribbon domain-containing protein [Methylococcaceae bacterium]
MFSLMSLSNNAGRRASQLLITMLTILLLGKLIMLVPVMHELQVADTFSAAEIIWFLAKSAALIVFYYFARFLIAAIPNHDGALSFVKGVAEPLTALLLVIMGQALLWQLLAPFVDSQGRAIYYSAAIIVIVCISVWFVLRAYRHALYLVDAVEKVGGYLSRLIPQQKTACSQCGAEISTNAHFCNKCGHKTQDYVCCSECGTKVSEGQNYCQNCGSTLNQESSLNR